MRQFCPAERHCGTALSAALYTPPKIALRVPTKIGKNTYYKNQDSPLGLRVVCEVSKYVPYDRVEEWCLVVSGTW